MKFGHLEGEQSYLGELRSPWSMVINHLLSGMILQVNTSSNMRDDAPPQKNKIFGVKKACVLCTVSDVFCSLKLTASLPLKRR